MKPSQKIAITFLIYGLLLHTYTEVFESTEFSLHWFLWALSPYIVGSALLWLFRQPHAAVGALVLPIIMDTGMFYSVFIAPDNSTAPLGLLFGPLWNLVVFVPLGGLVGWWVSKRLRATALENKKVEPMH